MRSEALILPWPRSRPVLSDIEVHESPVASKCSSIYYLHTPKKKIRSPTPVFLGIPASDKTMVIRMSSESH
ncbi:hypothetical protein TWF225_000672 [Orbilia oligospora]|uniref:Uncharacterized protein n=1 Tax=Orbilia oligospora TaxID=2813651 RepID=A0A8H2HL35_ORBOL|nr:hypothetical protein TWF225_000672 [Orbilia oligospora]KAF3267563.1 hypothetical protein TWF128_009096 [Orbilia oligospora]TGJ63046.1 hypothetical protein EYR41_010995 [Orbilia oligospora]